MSTTTTAEPKTTTADFPATKPAPAPPAPPSTPTAGELAYNAYYTKRNGVSVKGEPLPKDFDKLDPPQLKDAWEAAAAAAIDFFQSDPKTKPVPTQLPADFKAEKAEFEQAKAEFEQAKADHAKAKHTDAEKAEFERAKAEFEQAKAEFEQAKAEQAKATKK